MTRAGIRTFWGSIEGAVPRVLVVELVPVMLLLSITLGLTIKAGPAMTYMDTTIRTLSNPSAYIDAVRDAYVVQDQSPSDAKADGGSAP